MFGIGLTAALILCILSVYAAFTADWANFVIFLAGAVCWVNIAGWFNHD